MAQQGVVEFHSEMAAQQFQAIYAQADKSLRQKKNEEDFVRLVAAFQRSLGSVQHARLEQARESWFSREKYVTLSYETVFAKGKGDEQFVFHIIDGHAALYSYHIASNDLLNPGS